MCGKSSTPSSPTYASTTGGGATSATTLPASPLTAGLYNQVLQSASNLGQTPFNPATLGQIVPWTQQQQDAVNQLYSLGLGAGTFDPAKIQEIMSPYIQNVVKTTQDWFNNTNKIQANNLIGQGIRTGNVFGGDRAGVAAAEMAGQQNLAQAPVIAGLYQSGYGQALNEYNLLKQMGLSGAQTAWQAAGLRPAYEQAAFDLAQRNAIQQTAYPFQLANWQASLAGGIGPLTGTTGTSNYNTFQTPAAPNPYSQWMGVGIAGLNALPSFANWWNQPYGYGQRSSSPTGLAKRGGLVGYDDGGRVPLARVIDGVVPHRQEGGGGIGTPFDAIAISGRPGAPSNWMGGPRIAPAQPLPLMQVHIPDLTKAGGTGGGASSSTGGGGLGDLIGAGVKALPTLSKMFGSSGAGAGVGGAGLSTAEGLAGAGASTAEGLAGAGIAAPAAIETAALAAPEAAAVGGGMLADLGPLALLALVKRGGLVPHRQGGGDVEEGAPYRVAGMPLASGRMTWFNPRGETGGYGYRDPSTGQLWYDEGAARNREGPHASGLPSTTPGLALPNPATLGQPVVAVLPDGRRILTTHTDIGPRGVVDLNAPLASRAYPGGPSTMPGGNVRVERPDVSDMALALNDPNAPVDPAQAAINRQLTTGRTAQAAGLAPGVTQIPGFAPRPRTPWEEWAASPITRAGIAMAENRSPFFGPGLASGIEAARGAIEERYKAETERDQPSKMITLEDGTIAFMSASGKLVKMDALKGKTTGTQGRALQVDVPGQGKQWIQERPGGSGKWFFLGTDKPYTGPTPEEAKAAATELVSGTPATKELVTELSKTLSPAELNTKLYDHNLFDYSTGSPGKVMKGFALPAPADIEAQGRYPGLSADALKIKVANYMLNGEKSLPKPRGTRDDTSQGIMKENTAVRNYAAAMFTSLGVTPDEVAERWRNNAGYMRWLFNPRGGLSVGSIGTVIDHLDTLEEIYRATAPGTEQPVINAILAKVGAATGSPVTTLQYAAQIVGAEIIKALGVAGGGGQTEREEAATGYGPRLTPDQFFGPMGSKTQIQKLLAGQLNTAMRIGKEAGVNEDVVKRMAGERAWNVLKGPAESPPPRPPGVPADAVWDPATRTWRR